eukprot:UC4_evm3s1504
MLVGSCKPMLCVGPTGTGKTVIILNKLLEGMPREFVANFLAFSARTSANQTQDMIDIKLDKRRKGIFGPPMGKKMAFFIDDLNMPAKEYYGAQPPLELLRQYMDHGGWYDRAAIGSFRTLIDMTFISAMGPPGGGRTQITERLSRHFNYVSFCELPDHSKASIFSQILGSFFKGFKFIPETERDAFSSLFVSANLSIFNSIISELRPTPAKSHYTFNLRDFAKIFQGMLMVHKPSIAEKDDLIRLFIHESNRVYRDRLINDEDRSWFDETVKNKIKSFDREYDEVVTQDPLLYGDFSVADTKDYIEMKDLKKMGLSMEESLEDYNAQFGDKQMKLVLFMDAMQHCCKISRILRQPMGNALLLGFGGSGRQSQTRLAAYMAEYNCIQIELSKSYGVVEWREDLKNMMLSAGLEGKETAFLFTDAQIKEESFLEDLNNILNSGDVPGIYESDVQDRIYSEMKPIVQTMGLNPTKSTMFNVYTNRIKQNLHIVIAMTPLGSTFRSRLRMFPALVNNCTIDWFSAWPDEALSSVANVFLSDVPQIDGEDEVIAQLVKICVLIHQSVIQKSTFMSENLGRINYVTPTTYLELLGIFRRMIGEKKQFLMDNTKKYANGLDKLAATAKEVEELQEELTKMQPMLKKAAEDAEVTMAQIAKDKVIAEETATTVGAEEKQAGAKAAETKEIADSAQRDLDEALPALDAALSALKLLNKGDITEVKALGNPPAGVRLCIEAVCIMQGIKPKRVAGEKMGTKVDDYWAVSGSLLKDPGKFLDSLFAFDKDNIPEDRIKKISPYIERDDFTPEAIKKVSKACTALCSWTRAMHKYHFVSKAVAPKRAALKAAQEELEVTLKKLNDAKARLKLVQDKIKEMEENFAAKQAEKKQLEDKAAECTAKLGRAERLIGGLSGERGRWADSVKECKSLLINVVGDIILSAGTVAYSGPFNEQYRTELLKTWCDGLSKLNVAFTDKASLISTLNDPVETRQWQISGLPNDSMSVENALMVKYSRRWPLFIDPQGQANKWIKQMDSEKIVIMKLTDRDFLRSTENAIRFGTPALLENVAEVLDPALEPVLLRQTFKQAGSLVIKLGESIVPYHEDFKLYITTKLPNPHYAPEISTKVSIINMILSPSGLEDQMLGMTVAEERPDLEEAKNQLIISNAKMAAELKDLETKILTLLAECEGSPVDDVELIDTLDASKVKSDEISAKVLIAKETEKDIDDTRLLYVPVAVRSSLLFFCVTSLATVDPMYQYSLDWFKAIFLSSCEKSENSDDIEERIKNINDYFTFSLYSNVCRSLFEKDKLLFSFFMCVKIMMEQGKINNDEWMFLISGSALVPEDKENPAPEWMSDRTWLEFRQISSLPTFSEFPSDVPNILEDLKRIFDSTSPHRETFPERWDKELDPFQKLLVMKCLRPDMLSLMIQDFVASNIGQKFIEPQAFDLSAAFADSSCTTPLVFILSQGTDPAADLYKLAEQMKFTKKLDSISLGQGMGPRAEAMMKNGLERGTWVFFQNCHLSPSWMPTLERLIEQIDPMRCHRDFRLWLTSMPTPKFPVPVLQNSAKMTVEPPKGIKANLLGVFTGFNDEMLDGCSKQDEFKGLLFSLCMFHSTLLERRKYGALGFNIRYAYTQSDMQICITQLKMFLDVYDEIPFKVLRYTAGDINYGGRVTDNWDRRMQNSMLDNYYSDEARQPGHSWSDSGIYFQPDFGDHQSYMDHIKNMPINDTPEIFGLHDNANITFANNECFTLLGSLVKCSAGGSGGGGGSGRDEKIGVLAREISEQAPPLFDLHKVLELHPILYEESMNTVLSQEVVRFNKLIKVVRESLDGVQKALKGLVVMSADLEMMANSLFLNQVPKIWEEKAYPSLKPLAAWFQDLLERVDFISKWIKHDKPPAYWISGFYFPQAFLTGTLQKY